MSAISSLREIGFYVHFHGPIYEMEEPDYAITCFGADIAQRYELVSSREHVERLMRRPLIDEEWQSWSRKTFTNYEALRLASLRSPLPISTALSEMGKKRGWCVSSENITDHLVDLCKCTGASFFTDDELFERSYGRKVEFPDL